MTAYELPDGCTATAGEAMWIKVHGMWMSDREWFTTDTGLFTSRPEVTITFPNLVPLPEGANGDALRRQADVIRGVAHVAPPVPSHVDRGVDHG